MVANIKAGTIICILVRFVTNWDGFQECWLKNACVQWELITGRASIHLETSFNLRPTRWSNVSHQRPRASMVVWDSLICRAYHRTITFTLYCTRQWQGSGLEAWGFSPAEPAHHLANETQAEEFSSPLQYFLWHISSRIPFQLSKNLEAQLRRQARGVSGEIPPA